VLGQEQIAGLLALVCLLLAVVQIGPAVVLIGTVIYVFSRRIPSPPSSF
jgi:hypothetical protein